MALIDMILDMCFTNRRKTWGSRVSIHEPELPPHYIAKMLYEIEKEVWTLPCSSSCWAGSQSWYLCNHPMHTLSDFIPVEMPLTNIEVPDAKPGIQHDDWGCASSWVNKRYQDDSGMLWNKHEVCTASMSNTRNCINSVVHTVQTAIFQLTLQQVMGPGSTQQSQNYICLLLLALNLYTCCINTRPTRPTTIITTTFYTMSQSHSDHTPSSLFHIKLLQRR